MNMINEMRLDFPAQPENEAFARLAVSGFLLPLDPTMEELADVKTAVSEAVTNAIVHGYMNRGGTVRLRAGYDGEGRVQIDVIDRGCGIRDVERARQPFFTTAPGEERSGMGFTVMESFMDSVHVRSAVGQGTTVRLIKHIRLRDEALPRRA
ncbi:MAG: anti-sigma F factor [Clostridia bacterium]|nr:anti-sigma F factor [Clostridia bacterium]